MDEKYVRNLTKDYILKRIDEYFEYYIHTYKDSKAFILLYPLLAIEYRFQQEVKDVRHAEIDRSAISWFLGRLNKKSINFTFEYKGNSEELHKFLDLELPKIKKYYLDYLICEEIIDDRSIAKSKFEEIGKGKYKLTLALITGGYRKEFLYYSGMTNKVGFDLEVAAKEAPAKRISEKHKVHNKSSYRKIKNLQINIDKEILELSNACVKSDLVHLGGNVKSNVINYIEELKLIIGFFHYSSIIQHYYNSVGNSLKWNEALDSLYYYDEEWLIKKINNVTKISDNRIKNYIDYFTYTGEGSLLEFPLMRVNGKILFVPSLWILNDFHFSIVNGHYYKKKVFTNRHKTISTSVVKSIVEKVEKYSNIIYGQEVYYEIKGQKLINSDIDVAIYDKVSNSFIIIECKWKDNHYINSGEENYKKIHQSLEEIYKEQISKHKFFVDSDHNNLSLILQEKISSEEIPKNPDILYIAVDKRSQLFVEDKILLPLYGLLAVMEKHVENEHLNLEALIKELRSNKTESIYINTGEMKEITIDDSLTVVTDEFHSI